MLCLVRVYLQFKKLFSCRKPGVYGELYEYTNQHIVWEATVPDNSFFIEELEFVFDDSVVKKNKIWSAGEKCHILTEDESYKLYDKPSKTPWIWIGGEQNGETVGLTCKMYEYIVPGNKITKEIISLVAPFVRNIKYIAADTFDEVEFPDDGITIEDDSRFSTSKKEE